MWEHMSKILHNLENCLSLQAMGQLDCRLVQVYNELWANTLSNHDMYLVRLPLPRLLQRVISYRWEWLTLAEVVLRTYNCQTRQWNDTIQHMMRGMRSQMRGWLQSSCPMACRERQFSRLCRILLICSHMSQAMDTPKRSLKHDNWLWGIWYAPVSLTSLLMVQHQALIKIMDSTVSVKI